MITPAPRLLEIEISDFRSISGQWRVPLDASVVLLHGMNGAGKTSVLSAIELASTGAIAHLDRSRDGAYRRHLNHQGSPSGRVLLQAEGLVGSTSGAVNATVEGADVQPLLTPALAGTFAERCFLPQATLSRLLEIYAPGGKDSADTSLIRFVKEILGLDEMEALIDGLSATRHVTRAERISGEWRLHDQMLDAHRARHSQALGSSRQADLVVDERQNELRVALAALQSNTDADGTQLATLADRVIANFVKGPRRQGASLQEVLLRLDGLRNAIVDMGDPDENDGLNDLMSVAYAEAEYDRWRLGPGAQLLNWARARGEEEALATSPLQASSALRALHLASEQWEAELSGLDRDLRAWQLEAERAASHLESLESLRAMMADVSRQRSTLANGSYANNLSSLLVSLLDHVDGDSCPFCDQAYSGTEVSLAVHVRQKVNRLTDEAAKMASLEVIYADLASQFESRSRSLAQANAQLASLPPQNVVTSKVAEASRELDRLRSLIPLAEAGAYLLNRLSVTQDRAAARTRASALRDELLSETETLAELLGAELLPGSLAQRVAQLRAVAQRSVSLEQDRQDRVGALRHALAAFEDARVDQASRREVLDDAARTVSRVQHGLSEAKRRKEVASTLRKEAETVRSRVVNRVFDERLNNSWARIFRALVPAEPFVPQFKKFATASRSINVELETADRAGRSAASPEAMLSQGNANTAAISLFIALHFAAPAPLPWLILDDPVQSMDDLHVSNFAALVKQLTRRYGRQVILAVHQRELFDYLSLELTPASPGEELLAVTLERNHGRTRVTHERITFSPESSLSPVTAA